MASSHYSKGVLAEEVVEKFYISEGYCLISKRYKKIDAGEIDLIFTKGNHLVFTEVKARKNIYDAYHSLTEKQILRIRNAAELFIAEKPIYITYEIRFDLAIVRNNILVELLYNSF